MDALTHTIRKDSRRSTCIRSIRYLRLREIRSIRRLVSLSKAYTHGRHIEACLNQKPHLLRTSADRQISLQSCGTFRVWVGKVGVPRDWVIFGVSGRDRVMGVYAPCQLR